MVEQITVFPTKKKTTNVIQLKNSLGAMKRKREIEKKIVNVQQKIVLNWSKSSFICVTVSNNFDQKFVMLAFLLVLIVSLSEYNFMFFSLNCVFLQMQMNNTNREKINLDNLSFFFFWCVSLCNF